MRKLTAMSFVSLDGVMQGPGEPGEDRELGFEHGGWAVPHFDEREVRGLLALLLANHARRATREDEHGRLLRLSEQDRARWDRAAIADADALVVSALRGGRPGRFALHAATAAPHAAAPSYADTDWPQSLVLYDELLRVWPSPVVALNRAVAVAEVDGPAAALSEVESLEQDGRLARYRYLPSVKADLLRRLGRAAGAAYDDAIALADNDAERAFLTERRAESPPGPSGHLY